MSTSWSIEEIERLKALRRYNILDTPREEPFDRVVRLAARWFDVPIALIALLDEERQWFKAAIGIDRRETAREAAFCAHHLYEDEVFVVEDTTKDPRFKENPLVTGPPGIRFYAGAPIVTPRGYVLGSLCLIDREPRDAGTLELDTLQDLADIVVDEMELRAAYEEIEEHKRQIQRMVEELTGAEESARERLSTLLHENLQQVLHSVRMTLEAIDPVNLADKQIEGIERAKQRLSEAVDITGDLSAQFAPMIRSQSLGDTLDWLVRKMYEVHGLSVTVTSNSIPSVTDETRRMLLYHAAREVLFNVVKTTECNEARISLEEENDRLRLIVAYDGKRFSPEQQNENGWGLSRIYRRIEAIGGRVETDSELGEETRITLEMPTT